VFFIGFCVFFGAFEAGMTFALRVRPSSTPATQN
jgi:hypothetical protein